MKVQCVWGRRVSFVALLGLVGAGGCVTYNVTNVYAPRDTGSPAGGTADAGAGGQETGGEVGSSGGRPADGQVPPRDATLVGDGSVPPRDALLPEVPRPDGSLPGEAGPPPDAAAPDAELPVENGRFCEVTSLLVARCSTCHRAGGNHPSLTADRLAEVVNLSSRVHPDRPLVVPGDPPGSLLFREITGTQARDEGARMPFEGAPLSPAETGLVEAWITGGAPTTCGEPLPGASPADAQSRDAVAG